MTITHLVLDYGAVLAWPPSSERCNRLAIAAGIPKDVLVERYYSERALHDRDTISEADYWRSIVDGYPAASDEQLLARLANMDVDAWSDPNPAAVGWLPVLKRSGLTLALLSNMPRSFWDRLRERVDWLRHFDHSVISGYLRLSKPEPAIFRHLLSLLACQADEVLFIDDNAANVTAARELGIRAEQYNVFDGGLAAIAARYELPLPADESTGTDRHLDTACAPRP